MNRYLKDPKGKVHKVYYTPNINYYYAHAYVRVGLFKKEHQYAAGPHVVDNLINRLEKEGWKECDNLGLEMRYVCVPLDYLKELRSEILNYLSRGFPEDELPMNLVMWSANLNNMMKVANAEV